MFIKDILFRVEFSEYSQRHYCKDFLKKYGKNAWEQTEKTILDTLQRSFLIQGRDFVANICDRKEEDIGIFKLYFRVAGTSFSPKTSGNRAIFSLSNQTGKIEILLVYHKNHCKKGHETQWFLEQIKDNFPEYKKLFLH